MTPQQQIIQFMIDEQEFYTKVRAFLTEVMHCNLDDPIILTSGDNSVLMRGEFAGYSLWSLKEFIARKEGKETMTEEELEDLKENPPFSGPYKLKENF